MTKQIQEVNVIVRNTPAEGEPDQLGIIYEVVDSEDVKLHKKESYIIDSPNLGQTVQAMWDTVMAEIRSREGIS